MFFQSKKLQQKAFTLIEALIMLFVFSIITMSFYQAWALGTQHIINAKNRLGATALANEQMEIVRSLIFDDIGTTTGVPVGTIARVQTVAVNNSTFTITTSIQFVDDPTDGSAALGTDSAPNDYKRVTIDVSWGQGLPTQTVSVSSNFSLDGVESVAVGTGVLSINVLNSAGEGVPGATLHVVNPSVSPAVDFTAVTDASGNNMFPGALASQQGYQISVSKSGYYGVTTYPAPPASSFTPINIHASVVAGSLTPVTLIMDQVSTIEFITEDPFGVKIPSIDFTLTGGLILGTETSGETKYDYTTTTSTDTDGEKTFTNRSPGIYSATLGAGETGYRYLHMTPKETTFGSISLLPSTTSTVRMVLADKTFSSGLITVKDESDGLPLSDASVQLENSGLVYDTTVTTDAYGQAFFPTSATPLVAGTYDVTITLSGYTTETGTLTVTGTQLDTKEFSLTAL